MTPHLTIEMTKLPMGGAMLKCTRADGSIAWQRNEGRRGSFFALHDLRHYAVECVLGCKAGFYGLIAEGWEILDTTGKGARGKPPAETIAVEHLVGMLDADSTNRDNSSAAELNLYAAEYRAPSTGDVLQPLTEQTLAQIRAMAAKLHQDWMELEEGATMKLSFPQS